MPMKISQTLSKPPGQPAEAATKEAELKKLEEACQEFEAIFLRELLKNMRSTVPGERSRDEAMYNSLFDGQVSECLARRGIGLGEVLMDSLARDAGPEGPRDSSKVSGEGSDNEDRQVRQPR